MESLLKDLSPTELILLVLVLGFVCKEAYKAYLERNKAQTSALTENTLAIQKLEIQFEQLVDLIRSVPKLKEDVRVAFTKIKELENDRRKK